MTPILGIMASQISGHLTPPSSFESIESANGTGSSGTITFTSIAADWTHLQIRCLTRSTRSEANSNIYVGFNTDTTTANYYGHYLAGDGVDDAAGAKIGTSTNALIISSAATSTANAYTSAVIDVLDYANASKYKTSRSLSGYDTNGDGRIFFMSGLYMSLSPITSIQITDPLGNFTTDSTFALYGVK
jgi:hypothetical protein